MQPVELGMEAALLVMRNGGSTVAAERTFKNILAGCKQPGVAAVWRLDFIAVSQTADCHSSTLIRPVGSIGVHLTRVAEVVVLGERVAAGQVAITGLDAEIIRITKLASPYAAASCVRDCVRVGPVRAGILRYRWQSATVRK